MRYLMLDSVAGAVTRSRAAWQAKIGRPVDAGSGTLYLWGVVAHPSNGQAALEIPDDGDVSLLAAGEQAALMPALPADWTPARA